MNGISLFSGAGIGEFSLNRIGLNITVANELISKRSDLYSYFYPNCCMIDGDIKEVKNEIMAHIDSDTKFLLATPPCQGISTLGKNKNQNHFNRDKRNFLIFDVLDIIEHGNFDYILIENVPRFLKMLFPYKGDFYTLKEILIDKYEGKYSIDADVLDAKDYGVPQTRPRAIIKMYRKGLSWNWPKKKRIINLKEAIGHLPSLDPGEKSDIPWHYAKREREAIVSALRNTPTGSSAFKSEVHYPRKDNGDKIKGFHNTYKRMTWDRPAPARTTYCGSMSSHNNVHPGRRKPDGTYSDPRVLTILETLIVSSLPENLKFPHWATDNFIRTVIGECIPPLMLKEIIKPIFKV